MSPNNEKYMLMFGAFCRGAFIQGSFVLDPIYVYRKKQLKFLSTVMDYFSRKSLSK
jgi:hypothetical protein